MLDRKMEITYPIAVHYHRAQCIEFEIVVRTDLDLSDVCAIAGVRRGQETHVVVVAHLSQKWT